MGYNIKSNLKQKQATTFGPVAILNIGLAVVAMVLVVYFISSSNTIAAQRYSIRSLSEKSASLSAENGALMAERARFEDSELLSDFARAGSMVEARDVAYIFENGSVAVTDRNAP